ncbi:MAG: hypothetical protein FWC00_00615 [Firmicutes bacterium]|nr:hypothetical protein [Bacillota bacterium]
MNQKTVQRYEHIVIAADAIHRGEVNTLITALGDLVGNDFQTAFEMWEFALLKTPEKGAGDIVTRGLNLFLKTTEAKTRQLFAESNPLQKLVYTSVSANHSDVVDFLGNFILSGKLDVAEECLSKLRANTNFDFGDVMKTVLESVFALYCEKHDVRVAVLNKKQKTLLQNYIDKIKGPNKALLTQRMKEI